MLQTLLRSAFAFTFPLGTNNKRQSSGITRVSHGPGLAEHASVGSLDKLPKDVLSYLLTFFAVSELPALMVVSRKMCWLCSQESLWMIYFKAEVPDVSNMGDLSWKEMYKRFAHRWKWAEEADKRAGPIAITDNGLTATRPKPKDAGTNPAVLAQRPFTATRNCYEVEIKARGSWIGIGIADRKFRLSDGSTLGRQKGCINSAFFCQDSTLLQMEGCRADKTLSQKLAAGDRIRVKVDLPTSTVHYYRNGVCVGSLVHDKPWMNEEIFPCINLSHNSVVTIVRVGREVPEKRLGGGGSFSTSTATAASTPTIRMPAAP